jgi:hypothetical protein
MMKAVYTKDMADVKRLLKDMDRNAGDLQVTHNQLVTRVNKLQK